MCFHTWTFAIFFIVVYAVYLAVKGTRLRNPWLLAASYFFYGWAGPWYLLLIAGCTTLNWASVAMMRRTDDARRRKAWLVVSLVGSLAALATFKYAGQLVANANSILGAIGASQLPLPEWMLPIGISFFTFQSLSYVIDYYRGNVRFEPSLLRYATFVALFPQLVAGPIERASHLLPQLRRPDRITPARVAEGLSMIVVGLFKKIALADYLGLYVEKVYDVPENFGAPALILATVAFAWQIYFDFSGYTDIARGAARLMGFRLMQNFSNPYLALSLRDFWRRWHISLSTWFRDYVYIPLGGSRGSSIATYRNLLLTMLICGLWHGASWTFLIWGALHAIGSAATRGLERSDLYKRRVPTVVKQLAVFAFVTFAWIFFRAATLGDAWLIVRGIFTGPWVDPEFPLLAAGFVVTVWAYQFIHQSRLRRVLETPQGWVALTVFTLLYLQSWLRRVLQTPLVRIALVVFMLLYLAFAGGTAQQAFIYFRF